MKKSFSDIFRENMGYILSALVVIVYILTALMTLNQTGKTVAEILTDSFIILVLGITLANTLGQQGLNEGDKNPEVVEAKKEHTHAQVRTQGFWYEADIFCQIKNKNALRHERERMLNMNALKYDDFFDDDARFIGDLIEKPKDKFMRKMIARKNKAIKYVMIMNITQISPSDLISETTKPNDPLARGRTKREYSVQTGWLDGVSKVATAVFGGLFTAGFLNANWGEIIYRSVIAIILLSFAVVKYYANYRFVITENKERITTATHWLDEFETMHNKGLLTKTKEPTQ